MSECLCRSVFVRVGATWRFQRLFCFRRNQMTTGIYTIKFRKRQYQHKTLIIAMKMGIESWKESISIDFVGKYCVKMAMTNERTNERSSISVILLSKIKMNAEKYTKILQKLYVNNNFSLKSVIIVILLLAIGMNCAKNICYESMQLKLCALCKLRP